MAGRGGGTGRGGGHGVFLQEDGSELEQASQLHWNLVNMQSRMLSVWGGGQWGRPRVAALTGFLPLGWVRSSPLCPGGPRGLAGREEDPQACPLAQDAPPLASEPALRTQGALGGCQRAPVGQTLFTFVFLCVVFSVSVGDRWVRADGFFNLLTIKRLYFDWFNALLWSVQCWRNNY